MARARRPGNGQLEESLVEMQRAQTQMLEALSGLAQHQTMMMQSLAQHQTMMIQSLAQTQARMAETDAELASLRRQNSREFEEVRGALAELRGAFGELKEAVAEIQGFLADLPEAVHRRFGFRPAGPAANGVVCLRSPRCNRNFRPAV